jgi:hypothetical protein
MQRPPHRHLRPCIASSVGLHAGPRPCRGRPRGTRIDHTDNVADDPLLFDARHYANFYLPCAIQLRGAHRSRPVVVN